MKTKTTLALLLCALPALAGAVDVAAPAAAPRVEMKAWAGPMAGAFVQIGAQGFQAQPYVSLQSLSTRLSALPGVQTIEDGHYTRLATALQAQGLTPQAFKALSPEARMQALQAAAKAAEAGAAADLEATLSKMPEKMTAEAAGALQPELARLIEDAAYLKREDKMRLGRAASQVKVFLRQRQDAFEAWLKDTPLNIRNGAFDGAGHIVKTEDGWRVGERSPLEPAYGTYKEAFSARLMEISSMRAGPWRTQALKELAYNAYDKRVEKLASAEGADVGKLRAAVTRLQLSPDPHLVLSKRTEAGRAIETMRRYSELAAIFDQSPQERWRRELTLLDGSAKFGYPSLKQLLATRAGIVKRAGAGAFRGMWAFFAGLAALPAASMLHAGLLVTAPLAVFVLAAMGFMMLNVLRRDGVGLEFDLSFGKEALRAFESKLEEDAARDTKDGLERFQGRLRTRFAHVPGVIDARFVAMKDKPFVSVTIDDARAAASIPAAFEGLPVTVHLETHTIETALRDTLAAAPQIKDVRVIHSGEPNMALRVLTEPGAPAPAGLPSVFRGLPVIVHD